MTTDEILADARKLEPDGRKTYEVDGGASVAFSFGDVLAMEGFVVTSDIPGVINVWKPPWEKP